MDERVNRSLKIYKILASKNDPSFNESKFRKETVSNINRSRGGAHNLGFRVTLPGKKSGSRSGSRWEPMGANFHNFA